MRIAITILILCYSTFISFAQLPHLDVEGHVKIIGDMNIYHPHDSTSLFIGKKAGVNTIYTSHMLNTYVGYYTGNQTTTGNNNSFFGTQAGITNSIGSNNSYFGAYTGSNNTTGSGNTFMGWGAGYFDAIGTRNTFIGAGSGTEATFNPDSLDRAIAIGHGAVVGCSHCAVIGGTGMAAVRLGIGVEKPTGVLSLLEPGALNPIGITQGQVGLGSTMELTTMDMAGSQATRLLLRGGTDHADIEFYRGSRENEQLSMFIEGSNGNLGLGTASPQQKLHVQTQSTPQIRLQDAGGHIDLWGGSDFVVNNADGHLRFKVSSEGPLFALLSNIGDWRNMQYNHQTGEIGYDNSSRRDKIKIQTLDENFETLLLAEPKKYARQHTPHVNEIGFIAEEFHELGLIPLVEYDAEGHPDGIRYDKMVTYIIPILRTYQNEMEDKENQIIFLEKDLVSLQKKYEHLEAKLDELESLLHKQL